MDTNQVSTWRSTEACNEVVSINLAHHLVGFEPGTFQFICNALTHWATLSKLEFLRWFDQHIFSISKWNPNYLSGPNLDIFWVGPLNAAPLCENYAKLYFDAKHKSLFLSLSFSLSLSLSLCMLFYQNFEFCPVLPLHLLSNMPTSFCGKVQVLKYKTECKGLPPSEKTHNILQNFITAKVVIINQCVH